MIEHCLISVSLYSHLYLVTSTFFNSSYVDSNVIKNLSMIDITQVWSDDRVLDD